MSIVIHDSRSTTPCMRLWLLLGGLGLLWTACSSDGSDEPMVEVPPREAYNMWLKVEPPGMVCGNGSQYKFFVNFSDVSNDLVVYMEPGGACWDYPSCTGQEGIRGAANIDGLPDDHYIFGQVIAPFFSRESPDNDTRDWNMIFVPYCTGDAHTGNAVITYSDPEGLEPDVVFHHTGHENVQSVIDWIAGEFPDIPRLLMTGCSAGGVGALVNYYYFRSALPQVQRGYLLSDSGPIFPSRGNSAQLHQQVRESWNLDPLLAELPMTFDTSDFGSVNSMLASEFPDDRMADTYFIRDYNFSLYLYERFFNFPPKEEILQLWWEDTQLLVDLYDRYDNLAYYLPYWREINDSHCTTLFNFEGSEIQEAGIDLHDFIELLLDDARPLESYMESPQPGEDTP